MKQRKTNDDFAGKVSQQLDDCLDNLDDEIVQRLRASREKACTETSTYSTKWFFNIGWKQSAVFVSACFLMVTVSVTLFSIGEENILLSSDYDVTDDALIAEYDLLSELEFISWLVEEEHKNENNAS